METIIVKALNCYIFSVSVLKNIPFSLKVVLQGQNSNVAQMTYSRLSLLQIQDKGRKCI